MLYILSALSASVAAYLWIEVLAIDLLLKRWMGMDESYSFETIGLPFVYVLLAGGCDVLLSRT
jgi:hypothetical protein